MEVWRGHFKGIILPFCLDLSYLILLLAGRPDIFRLVFLLNCNFFLNSLMELGDFKILFLIPRLNLVTGVKGNLPRESPLELFLLMKMTWMVLLLLEIQIGMEQLLWVFYIIFKSSKMWLWKNEQWRALYFLITF